MKKIIAAILCLMMILSVAACGGTTTVSQDATPAEQAKAWINDQIKNNTLFSFTYDGVAYEEHIKGWKKTVENVLKLEPEHISCYGLKLEENTPLYARQDQCNLPDDDIQADMYLAAVEILREKGYRQYEISNFAKREMASKHNLKYWNGGEYLGFGPDASSDFAGKRFSMVRDIRAYIKGVSSGGQVLRESQQILSRERAGEYLMLRLRTAAGINREEYEKRYLLSFQPLEEILEKACQYRLAQSNGQGGYRLTPEGFLVSNSILSDLLLAQENSETIGTRL
jgi:oxygen-independent coproporphyrinogen-3 oxidase